jgi:hypothetical protein
MHVFAGIYMASQGLIVNGLIMVDVGLIFTASSSQAAELRSVFMLVTTVCGMWTACWGMGELAISR